MVVKRRTDDKATTEVSGINNHRDFEDAFTWSSPIIREDKQNVYYDAILIRISDDREYKIFVGDTVLFQSDDTVPFIGAVDQLFEIKSTGRKCVRARWFFRQSDVKLAMPTALDAIPKIVKSEVFYSNYLDINEIQSILRPCGMIFVLTSEDPNLLVDRGSKDTFLCRYKFDAKTGITSFKKGEIQELSKRAYVLHNQDTSRSDTTSVDQISLKRSIESIDENNPEVRVEPIVEGYNGDILAADLSYTADDCTSTKIALDSADLPSNSKSSVSSS